MHISMRLNDSSGMVLELMGRINKIKSRELGNSLSLKAPADTGPFYFFNQTHKPIKHPPIPGIVALKLAT